MERIEPAPKVAEKKDSLFGVRANLPKILGVLALIGLALTIGWVIYSAFQPKNPPFVLNGEEVQLSKDVIGEVYGYERRETEGDIVNYYVKADKAVTFSDNHQELENVLIQVYDEKGEKFDKITSNRAIYLPNANDSKLFAAQFTGNVDIESKDGLKVKTELITYNRETEIAETPEPVEFERDNVKGKSIGATVNIKERQIELLKEVEINANADPKLEQDEVAKANLQSAKIVSGYAKVKETTPEGQPIEQNIYAKDNVVINLVPLGNKGNFKQPTDVKGNEITAFLIDKKVKKLDLVGNTEVFAKSTPAVPEYTKINANQQIAVFEQELLNATATGNVYIETNRNAKPSKIRSQYAYYDKPADRFDLKDNVEIITVEDNQPTVVRSNEAIYEQTNGKIFLNGNGNITQGNNLIKGDNITAQLFPNKKLQHAVSKGNAYVKQVTPERTSEITGNELNVTFNANNQTENANVVGSGNVVLTPSQSKEYSKATLSAPNAIRVFYANGVMNQMQTDGRTTVRLDAPNNNPNASHKRLIADNVKSFFHGTGKDLSKVEAVGNAELFVEPITAAPSNYKTTVTAPRFDCDFYEAGNIAKNCSAMTKAKAVRVPTVAREGRGNQTLWGDKLNAQFYRETQDVQQFDAIGNAKFNELDRNGTANLITYTAADEMVRLRGGEPTVFDSQARAKSNEIDWDTKNQKTFLRDKVATTYYSQKQTGGATPFTKVNSPVYLTSDQAQFDHVRAIGIYTGNARAWQDNNYVRANELILYQNEQRFEGEGKVQSLLYNITRKEDGKVSNQPITALSEKIAYNDKTKVLHYEKNVDIRQGTDRITAGIADIYLAENNEMKQTIVQNDVVITQPNRRATGTWAQYTAADEIAIIRGNPATAQDSVQGQTQGAELTVLMKQNQVINQGTTKQGGTGRTRSVYKVNNQ